MPRLRPGPSPRGWGNPRHHPRTADRGRAIPTRVGKSPAGKRPSIASAGHPHAGGEIQRRLRVLPGPHGPSPRGWGNLEEKGDTPFIQRAIPTRVGKSFSESAQHNPLAGHPHAGGEIYQSEGVQLHPVGPSPRGWGNRGQAGKLPPLPRAIPTRVGKSSTATTKRRATTGHPHAGGEITRDGAGDAGSIGPSPRGWGNRRVTPSRGHSIRAIPTRVGKSHPLRSIRYSMPGHPHAGGEIRRVSG